MKKIGEIVTVEPGKPVSCANPQVPGFVFGNYPHIAVAEPVFRIENLLFEFRNVNGLTDGIKEDQYPWQYPKNPASGFFKNRRSNPLFFDGFYRMHFNGSVSRVKLTVETIPLISARIAS
jgi:hypothetical protein